MAKDDTIIVRVPKQMRHDLEKLAILDEREFSDFIRLQWKKLIEASKSKEKEK